MSIPRATSALFLALLAATACAKGGGTSGQAGGGGSTSATTSATGTGGSASHASSSAATGSTSSSSGAGGAPGQLGDACTKDGDCASTLCKEVLGGSGQSVCVASCTQQSDCGASGDFFCDPLIQGSASGFCVPKSPAHCASCTSDVDCGSLSEVCTIGAGDNIKACHIDCDLAGDAACPSDYSCTGEMVGGQARMLCMPKVPTCLDALGGFCDRVMLPEACTRVNMAGSCVGQRTCDSKTARFSTCGADAPQCKADCSAQDPAGCMTQYCASAISTPDNCGKCGMACPGLGQPNDAVACNSMACTFSCLGEAYDIDANAATGCEKLDSPFDNHTQATAVDVGTLPCDDTLSKLNISGQIDSDARAHSTPPINGFNVATGAAPDYFHIYASGGAGCHNDLNATLQITGSFSPTCYKLTANTSNGPYSCKTSATGSCSITNGPGSYADMSDIYFVVEKTCGPVVVEEVKYKISGHL